MGIVRQGKRRVAQDVNAVDAVPIAWVDSSLGARRTARCGLDGHGWITN